MNPLMRGLWACSLAGTVCLAPAAWASGPAAPFAADGSRASLTVEYRFEARGRKQDKYDAYEWTVLRQVEMSAELAARRPQPLPALHPMEAQQQARQQQQQAQAQKAATQMAPLMASAEAIMAKCGDDEKCMEAEAMKLGAAMAGTQQLADTQRTARETQRVMRPDAPRYQMWEGRTQKGSYRVDESWKVVHADPICVRLPGARCTHAMTRQGSGALAASATGAVVEVDTQGNSMVVTLPIPHAALAHVETHTTDEPEGTHSVATPKGPQPGHTVMRLGAGGQAAPAPLRVALSGGWRSQAGEQTLPMEAGTWHGAPGSGGRLVVRWRFSVH